MLTVHDTLELRLIARRQTNVSVFGFMPGDLVVEREFIREPERRDTGIVVFVSKHTISQIYVLWGQP
jgi:hypothetical protein